MCVVIVALRNRNVSQDAFLQGVYYFERRTAGDVARDVGDVNAALFDDDLAFGDYAIKTP